MCAIGVSFRDAAETVGFIFGPSSPVPGFRLPIPTHSVIRHYLSSCISHDELLRRILAPTFALTSRRKCFQVLVWLRGVPLTFDLDAPSQMPQWEEEGAVSK